MNEEKSFRREKPKNELGAEDILIPLRLWKMLYTKLANKQYKNK